MNFTTIAAAGAIVLALGAATAQAGVYYAYNALGGAENGGDPLAAAGPTLGDVFTATSASTLSSISLDLSLADTPSGSFQVDLVQVSPPTVGDSGLNLLGPVQTIATVNDSSLTSAFSTYTYKPSSKVALGAGDSYLVGIFDNLGNSNAVLGNTLDPLVLGRPSVARGAVYYNNGGVQANAGGPYEIAVAVSGVPEPTAWALMLVGFGGLGMALRGSRRALVRAR